MKKCAIYMKLNKLLLILFLIFILPNVSALTEGQSTVVSGKTITLVSVGPENVVVDVDGIGNIISLGKTKYVNGATITVNSIDADFDPGSADLSIVVNQECGDDVCSGDETQQTCCKDCGCNGGLSCTENRCINPKDNECEKSSDCNDNNQNTVDICSGVPRECSNKETICEKDSDCDDKDGLTQDTCINNLCNFVLYSDLAECNSNEDCNDSIACTKDKCEGLPLKCVNEEITSCGSYDDCCPLTCSYPDDLNCKGIKESEDSQFDKILEEDSSDENITAEVLNATEGEIGAEEKASFFKRIINWLKNLFTA